LIIAINYIMALSDPTQRRTLYIKCKAKRFDKCKIQPP